MGPISHDYAFQVLLLQAADEGRGELLFGDSVERAKALVPPFLAGESFPDVYLEHPLMGDPSLDVTLLYGPLDSGTRIDSPAAGDHGAIMDFYAAVCREHPRVSFGFELDTSRMDLPEAAIHFQPRGERHLVRPFCEAAGEAERAGLYLAQDARMPPGWELSFFGMFRGRPSSPLRVCGYLSLDEQRACAKDPSRIGAAFDAIGFSAYDDRMIRQISELVGVAPIAVDFQFDIFSDGTLGPTFALDIQFGIERPQLVLKAFEDGQSARVIELLERLGIVDGRWRQAVRASFARWIPIEADDGSFARFSITLMPQWVKVRWTDAHIVPSKLYHLASSGVM